MELNGRPLMVREDREDRDVKNYQMDHARETRNEPGESGKCQVGISGRVDLGMDDVGVDCSPRDSIQVHLARAEGFF